MPNIPLIRWDIWTRLDAWTLAEANALLCNADPDTITDERWPDFLEGLEARRQRRQINDRLLAILTTSRLLRVAHDAGVFGKPLKSGYAVWRTAYPPAVLCTWSHGKAIPLPDELIEMLQPGDAPIGPRAEATHLVVIKALATALAEHVPSLQKNDGINGAEVARYLHKHCAGLPLPAEGTIANLLSRANKQQK